MSGLDPFEPDDIYCVHCHAPAAGMCAQCGALCCGNCVELRMGLTRHRAVCRMCVQARPNRARSAPYVWLLVAFVVTAIATWWFW